ncbi:hypothetical protein ACP70R_033957 [Stipagrostis hirtigluma subsp. patula]
MSSLPWTQGCRRVAASAAGAGAEVELGGGHRGCVEVGRRAAAGLHARSSPSRLKQGLPRLDGAQAVGGRPKSRSRQSTTTAGKML